MKKIFAIIAVSCHCALAANAQTVTFESEDYKSVGVYDSWEASPFRTGILKGNAAVVENPFKDERNATGHVLGVQRSRFASNMFGARIDLNQTFELAQGIKYVHVLLHKPTGSRVMLMGLGKRRDRASQSPETEQFWERTMPVLEVQAGRWFDAVFAIKGGGGIDIHSLVVVVDATSPHALAEDFVAYVDEIEVNDNPESRTAVAPDYALCFHKEQECARNDRKMGSVSFEVPSSGVSTFKASGNLCYSELFSPTLNVKAGETVIPSIEYTGPRKHSYIYIDKGRDGQFSCGVGADGGVDEGSDLVSFSSLNNTKADGSPLNGGSNFTPSAFTIPAGMAKGRYRMRCKLDVECADPAGSDGTAGSSYIVSNGGGVIDLILNVHEDSVAIARSGGLNGDIVHEDGSGLDTETIPFGQPYRIYMKPAPGFAIDSLVVRHGYNLDSDAMQKSTPQWVEDVARAGTFGADGSFTIPAAWVDGDIKLMPEFVEK